MVDPYVELKYIVDDARLLDEHYPGWYEKIDLNEFNVHLTTNCILAYVFGSFTKGLRELGLELEDAYKYGFAASYHASDVSMTGEWKNEILARKT